MKNKFRNLMLAVILLLAFVGGGIVFYSVWVVQKPFGVIVFLVPELESGTLAATRLYAGGGNARLMVESSPGVMLLRNAAPGESEAGVFATYRFLSTGPGEVGAGGGELPAKTLFQRAEEQGRITGLVTNGRVSSPALAAFYSHGVEPMDSAAASLTLLESVRPAVVLGGGADVLLPDLKGGLREDGRDLFLEARQGGYDIVRNLPELRNTPTWRQPRVFGVFSRGEISSSASVETAGQPTLSEMVAGAIQLLQFQRRGYFLVVDCSRIGSAAAGNSGEELLREILAMDEAVKTARQFAGESSLILVAGTVSTGGFTMNANASEGDSGLAVLSPSASGMPAVTWSTGPGNTAAGSGIEEPVAFRSEQAHPVVVDMLGFWFGPEQAKPPVGIHDNTIIFELLNQAM